MFYTIYSRKFSLSSISTTKIYINLEIPKVAEIIDKCIFLKFIITKKSLINYIYYLTKFHLHYIFFWKKFNDRKGQKHDPIQEIPKIYAKKFIGGFIFKEYEDNNRDKMHWMRSYETYLLIISNYTYHLDEKIIIHHIIYIKK